MSDTGCLILNPVVLPSGLILCQTWENLRLCMAPTIPANTTKWPVDAGANSQSDFDAARQAMQNGGNNQVIFRPGPHRGQYRARGAYIVGGGPTPDGTSAAPNWITQEDGATLEGFANGGQIFPVIDVSASRFWNVVGLDIIGSEFYGIRYQLAGGDAANPAIIYGNRIRGTQHGAVQIQGWWQNIPGQSNRGGSEFVRALCNDIADSDASPGVVREFQEGFYLGSFAGGEWGDTTHDIDVLYNDVSNMGSDLFEIKPGCYNINGIGNLFHDSALHAGTNNTSIPTGHITLVYPNSPPTGIGGSNANIVFARNRLWNLTQATGSVRPPISVSIGGVTVESNIGWNNQHPNLVFANASSAAGNLASTGIIRAICNTSDGTVLGLTNGFGFLPTVTGQSNVPDQQAYAFVGPTTGTADAGEGPGSGFAPVAGSAQNGIGCTDATGCAGNSWAGALMEDQRA